MEEEKRSSSDLEDKVSNIIKKEDYIKLPTFKFVLLLIGLSLSIFVSALDNAIVATSTVSILKEFQSSNEITWLGSSYLLTDTAFMPLYGKFSDLFGRQITMLFALFVFLIGSILSGISTSFIMLILSRALSGIGGAGLISLSIIIIADITPIRRRGLTMAIIEAMFGLSSVAGPFLGGFFSDYLTWRWSFYINIPISSIAIITVYFVLRFPNKDGNNQDLLEKIKRIDIMGSLLLVSSVTLFVLGSTWGGNSYPWLSIPVLISLVLSLVILIAFVYNECRFAKEPIIPRHIFNRNVICLSTISFLNGAVMFVFTFYIPLFFQEVKGLSAIASGFQLTPLLLGIVVFALFSGIFVAKTGTFRLLEIGGTFMITLGLSLFALFDINSSIALPIIFTAIIGGGIGLCIQINTIASQASVDTKDVAVVTSFVTFLQSLGGIFGLAIQGAIYNNHLYLLLVRNLPRLQIPSMSQLSKIKETFTPDEMKIYYVMVTSSIKLVFLSMIAYSVVAFLCSLCLKHVPLTPKKSDN